MERCAVLKDTVKEFDDYLIAYREKHNNTTENGTETVFTGMNKLSVKEKEKDTEDDDDDEGNDDDDDDFDDEDEEDAEYTPEEAKVVEKSLELMRMGYETIKLILGAITVVSDNITALVTTAESSGTVTEQLTELETSGMSWVAGLSKLSNSIQDQTTDLGAELYPPFAENIEANVKPLTIILLGTVGMAIDQLQEEQFKAYQTSELIESINSVAVSLPLTVIYN